MKKFNVKVTEEIIIEEGREITNYYLDIEAKNIADAENKIVKMFDNEEIHKMIENNQIKSDKPFFLKNEFLQIQYEEYEKALNKKTSEYCFTKNEEERIKEVISRRFIEEELPRMKERREITKDIYEEIINGREITEDEYLYIIGGDYSVNEDSEIIDFENYCTITDLETGETLETTF